MKHILALVAMLLAAPVLHAQPPASTAPTQVLTTLSVKPGIDRAELTKVMPQEVRDTLKLYLDGKIQQWFSRGDGRGVVFILNCATAAEAKAITDTLPLSKAGLATFDYMPIGPLA